MKTVPIRFPGINCVVCGASLQGEEALVHPNMRGPKGGKKYCHPHCMNGAKHNPFFNPMGHRNAGRRTMAVGELGSRKIVQKAGRQAELPMGDVLYMSMSVKELLEDGSAAAKSELARRGRREDGTKKAWGPKAKSFMEVKSRTPSVRRTRGAYSNPYDY